MTRPRRAVDCPREPIGLSAEEAAAFIGVAERTFAAAVEKGLMPGPRALLGRRLWDAEELKTAFHALPRRGLPEAGKLGEDTGAAVDWSDVA